MSGPQPPTFAATVVLLREGPTGACESLVMRRHQASSFMGGATVFPGGKLDPADFDAPAQGRSDRECADLLGIDDVQLARAAFVSGLRELDEEALVLLARTADGRWPTADQLTKIHSELRSLHRGHRLEAADHHRVLTAAGLTLALDLLVPFARWLTPAAEPVRFDAWFFAALLPKGQHAQTDGHESTEVQWLTPADAMASHACNGPILLPPPTWHTLARLGGLGTRPQDVLRQLGDGGVGPRYEPFRIAETGQGPAVLLPSDPQHPQAEAWREAVRVHRERHEPDVQRFVWRDGRMQPQG